MDESSEQTQVRQEFLELALPGALPTQPPKPAAAAKDLDDLRNNWLNPPEWTREEVLEFPGSVGGPWGRYVDPDTVRWIDSAQPGPLPDGEE